MTVIAPNLAPVEATAAALEPTPARVRPTRRPGWLDVCAFDDLVPERGVCALVAGRQVAIFRTHDGVVFALSNYDPVGRAFVLSRGIVGSRAGVPTVASPLHKQVFDLRTGCCLDDPSVTVPVVPVRRRGARVEVGTCRRG